MANSYKDIIITPYRGSSTDDPKIEFRGANTSTNTNINLKVYPTSNGTLSFEGSAGQLFSLTNDLSGTIFSVNDVSGIPSIEVLDTGTVELAQYSGEVVIGTANTPYTSKLVVSRNYGSSFINTGSHIQIENANTTSGQSTLGFTFGGIHKAGLRADYSGNLLFNSLNNTFYFNQDYGSSSFAFNTASVGSFLNISGKNVTFPGQILSTDTWDTTTGGGNIYLNSSTGNRIDWNTNGVAAPATTTRSAGTKLVLYPAVSASTTDYGLGIESSYLWNSVADTTAGFKWYANTTMIARLTGSGNFRSYGSIGSGLLGEGIGQFNAVQGSSSTWYSAGFRNDGVNVYLLSSNVASTQESAYTATWNNFRPFTWTLTTGIVSINASGQDTYVGGPLYTKGTLGVSETGGGGNRLLISSSGSGAVINQNDNSNIVLQTAGVTRLTITHSSGNLTATGSVSGTSLISTVATGTAPLTVSSTTLVSNLNADLLDGISSGSFLRSDASTTYSGGVLTVTTPAGFSGNNTGQVNTLQVFQATGGADAFMTFHVQGDYAAHFGLDGTTNDLFYGGWSNGANKYRVCHAANLGNFTHYIGTTAIALNRASASQALTGITTIDGAAFGLRQTDGTSLLTPVSSITTSGSRSVDLAPNTYRYGIFSEFKNSSTYSSTGNYSSLITYAPWDSTTASTGDPSYQLLFSPTAANSNTAPTLKIRAGIDTSWGSWATIWHSVNDGAGSGLDADLLDGQHGTYYTSLTTSSFNQANTAINNALGAFNKANTGGATLTDDTSTNANRPLVFTSNTNGQTLNSVFINSTELYTNPSTGTLFATIFSSLSDESQKDNIIPLENSSEVVNKMNPVSFNWKKTGKKSYGVIAQEIEKILPDIVHENNGVKSVEYDSLIAFLIKSIQELSEDLDETKSRLSKLEKNNINN